MLFGYWSSFVPDNTVSSSWSLFTTILKDPTPKVGFEISLLNGTLKYCIKATGHPLGWILTLFL